MYRRSDLALIGVSVRRATEAVRQEERAPDRSIKELPGSPQSNVEAKLA